MSGFKPGKYDAASLKKLNDERKIKEKLEKEKIIELKRLKELKKYEEEKEIRHKEWLNKGQSYYEKMVNEETQREDAAEHVRLTLILQKKEREEQQKRVKEAYANRMNEERRRKEEEEKKIASCTRWYDDASRYVGDFLEGEYYQDGVNTLDRRNLHRTPHGKGIFYVGIIERYQGDYFFGQRHGKGIYLIIFFILLFFTINL